MSWFSAIMFVISMGVQAAQASRARAAQRAAAEAADAAKGFQIVTSGEPAAIPVVYGRVKIGGSRVYHKTVSSYVVPDNINVAIAANNGKVMLANSPIIPMNPPAGWVRAYFEGPANLDVEPIRNTLVGVAPTIVQSSGFGGGNYDFGAEQSARESRDANEAASKGGSDPGD